MSSAGGSRPQSCVDDTGGGVPVRPRPPTRPSSETTAILLPLAQGERLLATVEQRLPRKSFGYLLSDGDARHPTDFLVFEANMRNDGPWKAHFESYGQYFVEHEDAGFVATPEESWRVQHEIWARSRSGLFTW